MGTASPAQFLLKSQRGQAAGMSERYFVSELAAIHPFSQENRKRQLFCLLSENGPG
jgi:hypothetical protein